jgi:hypothetical protein
MDTALEPSFEMIAKMIAGGGGAACITALAVWLSIKAVDLVKAKTNGHGSAKPPNPDMLRETLRMICPLGTGRHTLDDVHDVLVNVAGGIQLLNDKQEAQDASSRALSQAITDLRIEIARSNGRGHTK